MATIPEAFATAFQHHQAGCLPAAEQIYRQILEVQPHDADALHSLGVINAQTGNHQLAVEYIERALQVRPAWAEAQANLGNALREQGRLEEAIDCYRRSLELKPDFALAHNNLGNTFNGQGKWAEAVAYYRRSLELQPDFAEAHCNLGNALLRQGNLAEAVACYRRALELMPDVVQANYNLGNALMDQGNQAEAVAFYHRALELKPDFAEAHNNLGNAFKDQRKYDEAVASYRRALELQPDDAEAQINLGNAFTDQGKLDEAIACYRRVLELQPDDPTVPGPLVHVLQLQCCWEDMQALSRRVIEGVIRDACGRPASQVPPFSFLALPTPTTAEQQLQCARQWLDGKLKATSGNSRSLTLHPATKLTSRTTIGYLSADFRTHPVASLIAELIEQHDRDRFVVYGYSYGADDGSPIRQRLAQAFDRFVDLKDASFRESAQRIADDGVDILVDLTGYTQHSRTEILALRPSPIQVNYLGFPGTMGAPFMDYILVDDFVVPDNQQPFFTEKLVHLPGCYMVNDSRRQISAQTPSRTACGLPEQGFVFCSFNNSYKITPDMFSVWMDLLKAIPDSVLWLQEVNRFVRDNLSREAQKRGVAMERLVFAPRLPLPAEHLARYRLADLFLDSFPVNAHTTASDALWAGCPVLTLAGKTFASRVAGSLLRNMGLPELITTSWEDYQATALELARNPAMLADLRGRLAANRVTSDLFSGAQFARNVEKAFTTMCEINAARGKPRPFAVKAR